MWCEHFNVYQHKRSYIHEWLTIYFVILAVNFDESKMVFGRWHEPSSGRGAAWAVAMESKGWSVTGVVLGQYLIDSRTVPAQICEISHDHGDYRYELWTPLISIYEFQVNQCTG